MEEHDEIDAFIDTQINAELVNIISKDIAPYTCQFVKQQANEVVAYASGVMVQIDDAYFIFTASHVIEDWGNHNRLFIEYGDTYISVAGKGCGTELDKENRIDSAYIRLREDFVSLIRPYYRFLPAEKLLYDEILFHEPNFCAYGYPTSSQKVENGKRKPVPMAHFMRAMPDKVFSNYDLDPLSHYILETKGKGVNIKSNNLEKVKHAPYGLSGGGLWYTIIGHDGERFHSTAHLIGIMTEFRKGKFECLIANRIEILLSSIHQNEGL